MSQHLQVPNRPDWQALVIVSKRLWTAKIHRRHAQSILTALTYEFLHITHLVVARTYSMAKRARDRGRFAPVMFTADRTEMWKWRNSGRDGSQAYVCLYSRWTDSQDRADQ